MKKIMSYSSWIISSCILCVQVNFNDDELLHEIHQKSEMLKEKGDTYNREHEI